MSKEYKKVRVWKKSHGRLSFLKEILGKSMIQIFEDLLVEKIKDLNAEEAYRRYISQV